MWNLIFIGKEKNKDKMMATGFEIIRLLRLLAILLLYISAAAFRNNWLN